MPIIKIDFFQIALDRNGNPPDLEGMLTNVFARDPEDRVQSTPDGWIHLLELREFNRYLSGVLLKAKTDQIPPVADRSGSLQDLLLREDQGIAGLTHFYYRRSNRILLMQRSFYGVRPGAFARYFDEFF